MEEEKGGLFCFYVSLRFLRQKFALGERWHPFFAESRNDDAEVERNLLRRRETASYRSSLPGKFLHETLSAACRRVFPIRIQASASSRCLSSISMPARNKDAWSFFAPPRSSYR